MKFESKYNLYCEYVEKALFEALNNVKEKNRVYEAMKYSLTAGGKRLRPVLALSVCEAYGKNKKEAINLAAALEMVHTYSLIHDDLPCMDNDDYRRHKKSCHKQFDEATALLAGDALLTMAFEMIEKSTLSYKKKCMAVKVLSEYAGVSGMVGGQILDLEAEKKKEDIKGLRKIHSLKTGALIKASVNMGEIASTGTYGMLDEFSEALGMAFQIRDDILDVESSREELGKTVKKDEKSDKSTFVSVCGIDEAKKTLDEETKKAKKALGVLGDKKEFLTELSDYLLTRRN